MSPCAGAHAVPASQAWDIVLCCPCCLVPSLCLSGTDLHFVPQAFQRQIHERLTQLELINKQYRRLARENRTDTASKLTQMVHEGNQRWDNLQKRGAAILRRLRVTCLATRGAVGR